MGTAEQVTRKSVSMPFIEIMDCTLRDGEQTSGVSFLPHEKLMIARKLLQRVNVDRMRWLLHVCLRARKTQWRWYVDMQKE